MKKLNLIGWLASVDGKGLQVFGTCCRNTVLERGSGVARLYADNVEPYGQTCANCSKELVAPRTRAWPELFPAFA